MEIQAQNTTLKCKICKEVMDLEVIHVHEEQDPTTGKYFKHFRCPNCKQRYKAGHPEIIEVDWPIS